MDSLLDLIGVASIRPILTALALPPVPFLLLTLIGARLILPRRGLGWVLIVLSVVLLWLSACTGVGRWLELVMVKVPPAVSRDRITEWRNDAKGRASTAVVVLGGGLDSYAPEYGVSNLTAPSLERLRYGLYLGRETGLPVAFSGGAGWGASTSSQPEAQSAARIAAQDFRQPLKWIEDSSRNTRENARATVPLLQRAGIRRIVLVTHGVHMPRALAAFRAAAEQSGQPMDIQAAPMGLGARSEATVLEWMPSSLGFRRVREALRETMARAVGA